MNIKEMVKGNTASFVRLRCNVAYYGISHDGQRHIFPVPLEDIGEATLEREDKAIYLMRYLRKSVEESTLVSEPL